MHLFSFQAALMGPMTFKNPKYPNQIECSKPFILISLNNLIKLTSTNNIHQKQGVSIRTNSSSRVHQFSLKRVYFVNGLDQIGFETKRSGQFRLIKHGFIPDQIIIGSWVGSSWVRLERVGL